MTVGGALGGQVYQPSDAPLFKTGHLVNAILLGVAVLCILAIKVMNKVAPHISVEKDDTSE